MNQNLFAKLHRFDSSGVADGVFAGGPIYFGQGTSGSLAVGATDELAVLESGYEVARITTDGDLDATFGQGGRAEARMVSLGYYPAATAIDSARGVLIAGDSIADWDADELETRLTVVRLHGTSASCTVDQDCDACEYCETGSCLVGSRSGCVDAAPGDAKLKIVSQPYVGRGKTSFLWKGAVPSFDPSTTDPVTMCLFHGDDRVMKVRVPAGGTCDAEPCWTDYGGGKYKYLDKELTPDGMRKVIVSPKMIKADARGLELQDTQDGVPIATILDVTTPPLLLQVHGGANACVEATFDTQRVLGNRKLTAEND